MRRRGERGETLTEVLVSTTLLGIIGIGIIGAIASVLISTDIDRRVSAGETVLRSYVAAIEQAGYQDCTAGRPAYSTSDVDYTPPANFDASVAKVEVWRAPDPSARPAPVATDTVDLQFGVCASPDPGLQKIVATVVSKGSRPTTETVTFFKRRTAT